jgi:hypothetical protein
VAREDYVTACAYAAAGLDRGEGLVASAPAGLVIPAKQVGRGLLGERPVPWRDAERAVGSCGRFGPDMIRPAVPSGMGEHAAAARGLIAHLGPQRQRPG